MADTFYINSPIQFVVDNNKLFLEPIWTYGMDDEISEWSLDEDTTSDWIKITSNIDRHLSHKISNLGRELSAQYQ